MAGDVDFELTGGRRAAGRMSSEAGARALKKFGQALAVTVDSEVDDATKAFFVLARANLDAAPGRYPKSRTQVMIRNSTVGIAAPWAPGAEWGSHTHPVFGKKQLDVWGIWPRRRAAAGKRPDPDAGYILGAAWRMFKEEGTKLISSGVLDAYADDMDEAGVPRATGGS